MPSSACPPPPSSTLFPYTTLFRSCVRRRERRDPRVQPQHPRRGEPGARRGLPTGGLRPRRLLQRVGLSRGNAPRARRAAADSCPRADRKSTRLNSSHLGISYAVFCLPATPQLYPLSLHDALPILRTTTRAA